MVYSKYNDLLILCRERLLTFFLYLFFQLPWLHFVHAELWPGHYFRPDPDICSSVCLHTHWVSVTFFALTR